MSRSEQLLQRLMHELRLKSNDIKRNSYAQSVTFNELPTGGFTVEVVWNGGKLIKVFDKAYVFGDVPSGAEHYQKKVCWYWRDIVRSVLTQRGVM